MLATQSTSRWNLGHLFSAHDAPEMRAAMADLDIQAGAIEDYRSRLTADISDSAFLEIVRRLEDLNRLLYRVYYFASLQFAADTQDQAAQTFLSQVQQTAAMIENRVLFFSLWWKDLDDENAKRLMSAAGDYRYWLEEMRNFKPHTLSEPEEKVINIKNITGQNALINLYDSITNRYVFKLNVNGEEKELTRGEMLVYQRGSDADLRARAYQELYRVYGDDGPILGQIYQTLVRDWRNEQVEMRNFAQPLSARNLMNNIPDEVVNTLLDVAERNAGVFQRYFRLKARVLGMPRLRRYDVYAAVAQSEKIYGFGQAAEMVLDSFEAFEPRVAHLAQRVFADGHLDSEVRKGKRSGAFCATVGPDMTPYVLVNYQGRADDIATLAHELGHAIHSMLAEKHTLFTQHSSLPLAETASTFGEMMLIDRLLSEETDETVRRDILFRQVDDAYATICRQAFFAVFERTAHDLIHQGAAVDELSAAYMDNLKKQFGDAVEISDDFLWEWVSIPHFYHTPFYVYAYAFGQLLVLALYQQYQTEGDSFKPRYLKILEAGGSEAPVRILQDAGIDIYRAEFWQGGFDAISRMIDQLEALPAG